MRRAPRRFDELHRYWVSGAFPRNTTAPGTRIPVFIDEEDRRCAMAHLVIESGHEDVAREIAASENTARVVEMSHPALGAWLDAHGLTLEEAQTIQPTYCFECTSDGPAVCGVDGRTYTNRCVAEECELVAVDHVGECRDAGAPPPEDAGPPPAEDAGRPVGEPRTYGCEVSPRGAPAAPLGLGLGLLLALAFARRR